MSIGIPISGTTNRTSGPTISGSLGPARTVLQNSAPIIGATSSPNASSYLQFSGGGPTPISAPSTQASGGPTVGGYGGTGGGSAGPAPNTALAGVYDAQLGRLGGVLGSLGSQQASQEGIVQGQYNQSRAGLDTSRNRGLHDLQVQQDQVNQNKSRSLNDLSARGRNLMQALNNQFGTVGAGSSSASQVLAPFAIAQQQNRLGGDINHQAQTQVQAIDTDRTRLEQDYKTNLDQLEQDRLNNLLKIGQQFQDLAHQIQDQMTNASAQKAAALGGAYNEAVSAANAQVAALEQGYQSKLSDINNYYSNYRPTVNTDLGPVDDHVQALNTAGYDNIGMQSPDATQQAVTAAYLGDNKDQQTPVLF